MSLLLMNWINELSTKLLGEIPDTSVFQLTLNILFTFAVSIMYF